MKISELINSGVKTYIASVRIVSTGVGSGTCRISVQTDSMNAAKLMLSRIYGKSNVLSIKEVVLGETTGDQPRTAQDLQVKSLLDKSSQLKTQAKKVKSLQKLQKAQKDYSQINSPSNQQTSLS
jgi:hypothetical protein